MTLALEGQGVGAASTPSLESWRAARTAYGTSNYPLAALSLLALVDTFQGSAFTVLVPDIAHDLGTTVAAMSGAIAVKTLAAALAPLPVAVVSERLRNRVGVCLSLAVGWSVLTLFTGFATSVLVLSVLLAFDGLTTGSVTALHPPLLMDSYPPAQRVRAMSVLAAAPFVGSVAAPVLVGVFGGLMGLSWRTVFVVMGVISLVTTAFCFKLREPGVGRWDGELQLVPAGDNLDALAPITPPTFVATCRELMKIRTLRRIFAGFLVFGLLIVPLSTFLSFFLEDHWNMGVTSRSVFFAYTAAASAMGLLVYSGRGERQFRKDPASVPRSVARFFALSVVCVVLGASIPNVVALYLFFGPGFAVIGPVIVGLQVSALSLMPSRQRPHAQALASIAIALGGVVGAVGLSGVEHRFGVAGSLISISIPGLLAAWITAGASSSLANDLAAARSIEIVPADEPQIKAEK